MCMMDMYYSILALLALSASCLSWIHPAFAYLAAILLFFMFVLIFLSVPLKLNWSSNLYGNLLRKFITYLAFLLLVYGISYAAVGIEESDGSRASISDSIYFSITTFTTVQYGEFRPTEPIRFLAALQSLMSITVFIPFFAAYGWLYCQNRLWDQTVEDKTHPEELTLSWGEGPIMGAFTETVSEKSILEQNERNKRVGCIPCEACGEQNVQISKIFEILGNTTPAAKYVAHCSCGQVCKPSFNIFEAAWRWRVLNEKIKHKKEADRYDEPRVII